MTIAITPAQLAVLAPSIRSSYKEAFAKAQPVLDRYEISKNALRVAHFMAQVLHESGGLTIQFENLNYSAARLPVVWPSRFKPKGALDPAAYAHNPEKLANEVYGNRMGNTNAGDGYKYRGRGLMQLTGRESYREATTILKKYNANTPDFEQAPDLVISAEWCIEIAAAEWVSKGCNALADADKLTAITKKINGGTIGLKERGEWLKRTKHVWR